jgi:Sodium:sulfate symporter transmembrane region
MLPPLGIGCAMAIAESEPSTKLSAPGGIASKYWGLVGAVAVLIAIMLLPTPAGLPLAGQRMLAIFGFAVVVWITEALDYAISAVVIAALMAMSLGLSPNVTNPKALYGTAQGLSMAVSGFSNTALTLVAAALFLAAAMAITGLDRRIALVVLRRVGARTDRCRSRKLPAPPPVNCTATLKKSSRPGNAAGSSSSSKPVMRRYAAITH